MTKPPTDSVRIPTMQHNGRLAIYMQPQELADELLAIATFHQNLCSDYGCDHPLYAYHFGISQGIIKAMTVINNHIYGAKQ